MKGHEKELKKAGVKFRRNYSLKKYTTFRIGGKADIYIEAGNAEELIKAVKILKKYGKKYIVLGNMSNVLIKDKGLRMSVIRLGRNFSGIKIKGKTGVFAGSAVKLSTLLERMSEAGIGGLEFMAGIPGSVGGAVFMNAGAYGRSFSSRIKYIHTVSRHGREKRVKNVKGIFSYRKSRFERTGEVITGVEISGVRKKTLKIKNEMRRIIKIRHRKHPWKACCAGSFFKNGAGFTAAKLVEGAGMKGASCGGAKVSEMHANFIINKGHAVFFDVIKLAQKIKNKVYKKYKIKLAEEVRIIK